MAFYSFSINRVRIKLILLIEIIIERLFMENTQIIQTKAKPIFKEEKEWIEKHLPEISPLPDDCWIVGGVLRVFI